MSTNKTQFTIVYEGTWENQTIKHIVILEQIKRPLSPNSNRTISQTHLIGKVSSVGIVLNSLSLARLLILITLTTVYFHYTGADIYLTTNTLLFV